APQSDISKVRRETAHNHAQVIWLECVGLHPLDKDSLLSEAPAGRRVVLISKERGDTGDPGIGRLTDDEGVLLARGQEKIARGIENDVQPRIAQNISIEGLKIRRGAQDSRFDFDAVNLLDIRIACHCRGGHSAAEADDENAPWCRVKDRSEMSEEQLSAS